MTASTTVPVSGTPATVPPDRARRWPAFDVCGPLPTGVTVGGGAGASIRGTPLLRLTCPERDSQSGLRVPTTNQAASSTVTA